MEEPTKLTVTRKADGALLVTWDQVTTDSIKIVRRTFDYPVDITDGVVVFDSTTSETSITDSAATPNEIYYYRLFFFNTGIWKTAQRLTDHDIRVDPNQFLPQFRRLMPDMYDNNREVKDDPRLWTLVRDVIMTLPIGYLEALIDFLPRTLNVDTCDGHNLACIAKYIGLNPNTDLTFSRQRAEIKAAVSNFGRKGTAAALIDQAEAVTGAVTELAEWVDNVLVSNYLYVGSAQVTESDPPVQIPPGPPTAPTFRYEFPEDVTGHSVELTAGDHYTTLHYGLYMHINHDFGVTAAQVRKLLRQIQDFSPIFTIAVPIFVDIIFTEQVPAFSDLAFDEIHDFAFDEVAFGGNVLFSNDENCVSNDLSELSLFFGVNEKFWDVFVPL